MRLIARLAARARRLLPHTVRERLAWETADEAERARLGREREVRRLRALPSRQPTVTDLLGRPTRILDGEAFLGMHREIVEEGIYDFRAATETPYMIDGGAHIGVSVLRFKALHPACAIVAFEPDPEGFAVLQENVRAHGFRDVTLVQAALSDRDGTVDFASDGSWGSRVADAASVSTGTVRTVRLRPYLDRRVDLLKLNIEGAETDVLRDCADLLPNVDRLIVEYHSFVDRPQTLHVMLGILAETGFRVYVRSIHAGWPLRPLLAIPVYGGMDLQLYVYAYREAPFGPHAERRPHATRADPPSR
jgi:FkbM family methyltransferase